MRYYSKVVGNNSCSCSSSSRRRGLRLHMKRLTVSRLRARFTTFFRLLRKYSLSLFLINNNKKTKKSHNYEEEEEEEVMMMKIKLHNNNNNNKSYNNSYNNNNNNNSYNNNSYYNNYKSRHIIQRSNSFYAEAIADCLDFIKRTSISLDHHPHSHP
ncbi:hypothetical protein CsatB_004902 [Cannabis sativa]